MLKGACREDVRYEPFVYDQYYSDKPVICYMNWVKTQGLPKEHLFVDNIQNICSDHSTICSENN